MIDTEIENLVYEMFEHIKGQSVPEEINEEHIMQFIIKANDEFDILTCGRWKNKELPNSARDYVITTAEIQFLQMCHDAWTDATSYTTDALRVVSSYELTRQELIKEFFEDPKHFDNYFFDLAFSLMTIEDIDLAIKLNKRSAIAYLRDLALEVKHV